MKSFWFESSSFFKLSLRLCNVHFLLKIYIPANKSGQPWELWELCSNSRKKGPYWLKRQTFWLNLLCPETPSETWHFDNFQFSGVKKILFTRRTVDLGTEWPATISVLRLPEKYKTCCKNKLEGVGLNLNSAFSLEMVFRAESALCWDDGQLEPLAYAIRVGRLGNADPVGNKTRLICKIWPEFFYINLNISRLLFWHTQ